MEKEISKLLLLYTGGTIGMMPSHRGYVPVSGYLEKQLESMPQFHDKNMPHLTTPPSRFGKRIQYDIVEYSPLMDSANMSMEDWVRMAGIIEKNYDAYDAFLILHGTDTMAYTASALSFMLENLGKTVILTGSQIPLSQSGNDGVENLLGALTIAGHYELPEVGLFFRSQLYRGNRVQKVDAFGLQAFDSGNFGPIATVGTHIQVNWDMIRPMPRKPFRVRSITNRNVAAIRIFPSIRADTLYNFLQPPIQGVVLETYGSGNFPEVRKDLMDVLRDATQRGVVIVNCTQCHKGMVSGDYAAGRALYEVGVISGADMTQEAALAKLAYLLSQDLTPEEMKKKLHRSLRGELTEPQSQTRFSFRERAFLDSVARTVSAIPSPEDKAHLERTLYPVLLCAAGELGDIDGIQRMIDDGADINTSDYNGRTALHIAAAAGHIETVRFLLKNGAQVYAVDRWGQTPLSDAVEAAQDEVASLLKEHGALLNPRDVTLALCTAASEGDLIRMRRLVEHGADPSLGDYDQRTPLHLAAAEGHIDCVDFLLGCGAPIHALDRWGHTPLDEALRNQHTAIVSLLQRLLIARTPVPPSS